MVSVRISSRDLDHIIVLRLLSLELQMTCSYHLIVVVSLFQYQIEKLTKGMVHIKNWMTSNFLLLNSEKNRGVNYRTYNLHM